MLCLDCSLFTYNHSAHNLSDPSLTSSAEKQPTLSEVFFYSSCHTITGVVCGLPATVCPASASTCSDTNSHEIQHLHGIHVDSVLGQSPAVGLTQTGIPSHAYGRMWLPIATLRQVSALTTLTDCMATIATFESLQWEASLG